MHLRRVHIPFFRIWYSSTYTFIFICTVILLATTPGDLIYQAIRDNQLHQVFVVGGVTLLTAILVVLVYSTRIYTNRSVLAAIPKSYLPIDDGEVGSSVRKLIVREWYRSAIIAWDARPRDLTNEVSEDTQPATAERTHEKARRRSQIDGATIITVAPNQPPWGSIAHNGWSSPSSTDLPGLQYWSVLLELPNLIEAKAVSLAPPDPAFEPSPSQQMGGLAPIPDERVVVLLRRPPGTGLREYLTRLSTLQLIEPPSLGAKFLKQYEFARFSTSSLSERQFRDLMSCFGELLAGMNKLDPVALVNMLEAEGAFDSEASSFVSLSQASSVTGSVRRYQTPGPSSVGRESPSVPAIRIPPSHRQKKDERMFSAVSHMSDDSLTRTRQGMDDAETEPDVDSVELSSTSSLRSTNSVIRRPAEAPD